MEQELQKYLKLKTFLDLQVHGNTILFAMCAYVGLK